MAGSGCRWAQECPCKAVEESTWKSPRIGDKTVAGEMSWRQQGGGDCCGEEERTDPGQWTVLLYRADFLQVSGLVETQLLEGR